MPLPDGNPKDVLALSYCWLLIINIRHPIVESEITGVDQDRRDVESCELPCLKDGAGFRPLPSCWQVLSAVNKPLFGCACLAGLLPHWSSLSVRSTWLTGVGQHKRIKAWAGEGGNRGEEACTKDPNKLLEEDLLLVVSSLLAKVGRNRERQKG